MSATAQIREGIRPGSGLYFYDCPECPCDFGAMTRDPTEAERQAAAHDAEFHAPSVPTPVEENVHERPGTHRW